MVTAIVLAAGQSTRMGGENKLLLPFHGKTMIENMVEVVTASRVDHTVVVLGHQAERVRPLLEHRPVTLVHNRDYEQGMASSIRAGLLASPPGAEGYMVCLTDLPRLAPEDLNLLLQAFVNRPGQKDILLPSHQGQRGNPVLFAARYLPEVVEARGPIGGCKGVVQKHPERVLEVELGNDHAIWDIDTPEDYHRLLALGA